MQPTALLRRPPAAAVAQVVRTLRRQRLVVVGAVEQQVVVAVAVAAQPPIRQRQPDVLAVKELVARRERRLQVAATVASRPDAGAASRASGIAAFLFPRAQ